MFKILLVGSGHMGKSLLKGWLNSKIKIENVINKYDLVRRKEFEIVKKMYETQLLRINKLEKIILTKNKKTRNKVQKTRKKSK